MRIALFSDTAFPQINGISRSIDNAVKTLAGKGHEIGLFTHENAKNIEGIEIHGYRVRSFFKYKDYDLVIPGKKDIRSKLEKFGPDVIHVHTPTPLGHVAIKYGKKHKVPIVNTYHTYLPEFSRYFPAPFVNKTRLMKKLSWKFTAWFYNKSDQIITPSEVIKRELKKHGIKKEIKAVSNGVDLEKFYPKRVAKKYESDFLHVGRIGHEKNIEVLLKAFSLADKKTMFILVGSGPSLEELEKEAKRLGISERTRFVGPKRGAELLNYYNGCKVFVTASTIETEGIVLLEAMACRKPIIGVDKLAIPEIIENGRNGYTARAGDHKQIAGLMNKLYKDKKLRESLGKNCLKEAKKYSVKESVGKLAGIYSRLLQESL